MRQTNVPGQVLDLDEIRKAKARRHLIDFIKYTKPDYQINWHHRVICDFYERWAFGDIKRLMLFMPPQNGKLIDDKVPVLTTGGWKPHGELCVGDYVFTDKGIPTKIVAISQSGWANRAVTFSNGTVIRVNQRHEWTTYSRSSHEWRTLETEDIKRRGTRYTEGKYDRRRFGLPILQPIQITEKELKIDPYFLGAWLGNGKSDGIVICYSDKYSAVIDRCKAWGATQGFHAVHKITGVHYQGFTGVKHLFREYNLINNKHIPDIYKQSSIEQRLQLLAGLIDTDGSVDKASRVYFVNCNKTLIDDVVDVVESLGFRSATTSVEPCVSSSGIVGRQKVYIVSFNPTLNIPMVLHHKQVTRFIKERMIYIDSIEECKEVPGKCIQVESPAGIYVVTDKFIPTHNSEIVSRRGPAWVLGKNPEAKFISASYGATLATSINRDVQRIMIGKEYQALFPESKINDKNIATTAQGSYIRNSEIFEIVGHTGRYFCAGVGGGISGQPMLYGNIDDALKGRQDAESKTVRESIWNWYNGDFYTRQGKDARILITATRWNEDDLPGRLLKLQESNDTADKWTVVSLPAIAEDPVAPYDPRKPGEPLWADRYPLEHLMKVRAMSEYDWASLYQQRPHNDAFNLFNTELMRLIEPQTVDLKKCKFYGALDPSMGGSDYAAIVTVALTPEGNWLVWDCDLSYDAQSKSLQKIIQKHQQFKYSSFVIESNSLGHAKSASGDSLFILELKKEQSRQHVAIPYTLEWHTKNKIDRIRSLQPFFANGTLAFRSDWAKTYPELINQMRLVPDPTAHDDGPDVLEMAIAALLNMNKKAIAVNFGNLRGEQVRPGWQTEDPDEEDVY